jgi:hypothetical protein
MQETGSRQFCLKDSLNLPVATLSSYLPLFVLQCSLAVAFWVLANFAWKTGEFSPLAVAWAKFLPLILRFYAE